MLILGIETSCDETAAAVAEKGSSSNTRSAVSVVSSFLTSSRDSHARTGGIIPEVAARRQIESIIPVIKTALSPIKSPIDAIAVTYGPGLIGSLLVGVETAKTLSMVWNKPLIPVNHLIGHLYANFIGHSGSKTDRTPQFPFVGLVVSGGHTDFVLMKEHGKVKYLGGTRDDAAGEAFDKTARLIGLPYPGGPEIAQAAESYLSQELNLLPRPMLDSGDLDTSFSGLKTAVARYIEQNPGFDKNLLAAQIQEAIVDTLVTKSQKAVEKYHPKSFLLAGGVSANQRLREKILSALRDKTEVFIPEVEHSTDNAAMVAAAALYNYNPVPWRKLTASPSLSIEE